MSFVSHSARTVTVNIDNNDSNDNDYSNSDSKANTSGAEANNDNTNGSTSTAAVVLRLASGDSSRKRGRSPTATAGSSSRRGGVRRGILKRQRTASYIVGEPPLPAYVPAPVPEIIANVEDATIPVERDSDLTDEEKAAKHRQRAGPSPGDDGPVQEGLGGREGREGGTCSTCQCV